ncbi:MAG: TonB-dependent receptor [Rhizobiaceae bacterium]
MVVLLSGTALAVLVGNQFAKAQEEQQEQVVNESEKKGRVTILQRLVIGAGVEKVAVDTPQAVTVLEQEDIDREQATTTGDMLKSVPAVNVTGSDRVFGEAFNIRGIGTTENSADGSRIVVTVDGAPKFNEQYRMGSFFSDPELYKRVEVLRGPASSTLYGAGALGGVINFQTKDASDFIRDGETTALRLKGGYETNGAVGLGSVILAHRFSDHFEAIATGNVRGANEDFVLGNGRPLLGSEFQSWSGLIKGTARFGDLNEQVLRLSYQQWQSDGDDQPYAQTSTESLFGTTDRKVTDKTAVLSYENPASDNPWLDLNINLSYSDTTNEQKNHRAGPPVSFAPGMPAMPITSMGPGDTGSTAILNDTTYAYRTLQLKADNTVDFEGERFKNYFTVGFQASTQDRIAERQPGFAALRSHPEGTENKLGLFAQNEFIWDERLTVITGVRGDFARRTPAASVIGGVPVSDKAFSPKIAALYKFNENVSIFGSVAHTERLPTIDELFTFAKGVSLDLRKEKSNNFEAGFTLSGYDLLTGGDSFNLKTTGFYNDLTDLIETTPMTVFARSSYNVGRARIQGVEVEAAYDSDYVFGGLGIALLDGKNLTNGYPLRSVPAHKAVVTLGARIPEWYVEFGARATFVGGSKSSVSAAAASTLASRPMPVPGYTLVDIFASWKPQDGLLKDFEAQFGVNNLFDVDYRDSLSIDRGRGRTFKFTLAKRFGV